MIAPESGRILAQKNADERRGMASTTKIMTVLCALDLVEAGLASLEQEIAVLKKQRGKAAKEKLASRWVESLTLCTAYIK